MRSLTGWIGATRGILTVSVCATLLWAGTALATATPQQSCNYARITAWKVYQACVNAVVAKNAKGVFFDTFKAFANCRHAYFMKWTGFQGRAKYAGSSCDQTVPTIGSRFTDNGDQTVTDNLSGLVWEKKDNLGGIHDLNGLYSWTVGPPYREDGAAFTTFLSTVNGAGFAGANGWRLPTLAELQTTVLDFACAGAFGGTTCSCPSGPCVDGALDPANTQPGGYYSATDDVRDPLHVWIVGFGSGAVGIKDKPDNAYVRAVRGGL